MRMKCVRKKYRGGKSTLVYHVKTFTHTHTHVFSDRLMRERGSGVRAINSGVRASERGRLEQLPRPKIEWCKISGELRLVSEKVKVRYKNILSEWFWILC